MRCPRCGSQKIWRDGHRYRNQKTIQRYICRTCGYRFSRTISKNRFPSFIPNVQTLEKLEEREKRLLGDKQLKGKLIEFAWWLKKQGYADTTIRCNVSALRTLATRGANLYDPDTVKDVIARQKWSQNRKRNIINAYTLWLKMEGGKWEKPKCKCTRKIPFIPTEQELDALIAGCGRKTSAFLQLLKETAMRSGEAKRLLWTDIDFERRMITLNNPEKGSNPRAWKVSAKLIGMLNALPRKKPQGFRRWTNKLSQNHVSKNQKTLSSKTSKSKASENILPHLPPLEGHNALSSN